LAKGTTTNFSKLKTFRSIHLPYLNIIEKWCFLEPIPWRMWKISQTISKFNRTTLSSSQKRRWQ